MADNNLRVRIVASDEATKVVEGFKKRLEGARQPAQAFGRAAERAAKGTEKLGRAAEGDPLGRVSNGLRSVGREAHTAFRGVGRLSVGLGSLAEVGEIGIGAFGAGGLAGIAAAAIGAMALTKHWADVGVSTSNAAANIGMTTGELYRYQRAAALTGVSSGAVTQNLFGLSQSLSGALSGQNPQAAYMLNMLGVSARDAHGHVKPLAQLLPQLADGIDKLNPYGQVHAVQALGMGTDMLPFLRQGSAKISAEMALLNQQGVGNNFGGSGKLYQDWQKLDTAASNTADIFAQKLAPSVDNVVNALTGFFNWLPHINDPSAPYSDRYGKEKKQGSRMIWEASGYVPGPDGYYTKNGNRPIFHRSPRGIIDNNPLNMHYAGQDGTVGQDGKFAIFKNMQLGVTAAANQLLRDTAPKSAGGHGLTTLASLISDPTYGWAPASDGNDDQAYISDVSKRTGIKPNAPLNLSDAKQLEALLNAQAVQETGQPIDTSILTNAATAALGLPNTPAPGGTVTVDINHNNVPPGTSATVSTSGSGVAAGGVKINKAMTGTGT